MEALQEKVQALIGCCDFSSALFWAERMNILNDKDACTVYTFLRCLYLNEDYHRVVDYVNFRGLTKVHVMFRFVMAQSLLAIGRLNEVIELVERSPGVQGFSKEGHIGLTLTGMEYLDNLMDKLQVGCQMNRLLAKALVRNGDHKLAVATYKKALQGDVFVADAAKALLVDHLTTADEKKMAMQWFSEAIQNQCTVEPKILSAFYEVLATTSLEIINNQLMQLSPTMSESTVALCKRAEVLYYRGYFKQAMAVADKCTELGTVDDSFNALQACIMHSLGERSRLFTFAKALTRKAPFHPVTTFVVGCYYNSEGNFDMAKQFFLKASSIDGHFGYEWVAHGNTCSADMEHDQAINCYAKARKILPGHPVPLAYTGVEYMVTVQYDLAKKYLSDALQLENCNPYILHEMGVTLFHMGKCRKAVEYFTRSLERVKAYGQPMAEYWEPLYCNMGACYIKLRRYELALEQYELALQLIPGNPPALVGMALVFILLRKHDKAMQALKTVRRHLPNDVVVQKMIFHATKNFFVDSVDHRVPDAKVEEGSRCLGDEVMALYEQIPEC